MTTFLFIFGVALVAVSGRLVGRAVVLSRIHLKAHLRELEDYGFTTSLPDIDASLGERIRRGSKRGAEALGRFLKQRFPALPLLAKNELSAAGFYELSEDLVHGSRALGAVGLPLVLSLFLLAGGSVSGLEITMLVLAFAAGWQLPAFIIRRRGSSRLDDVERTLPELLDLLIATIEAGMGFSAALKLVADRLKGALGDELRLTMRQQSLGMSVQQALDAMAERCDTPSMRAFVRTAARGETLGTSIGPVLRELSVDQRRRRRQAAREKMQKAPIKMLFPVMFLIFPALFIVLMYPAAYGLMTHLSGL